MVFPLLVLVLPLYFLSLIWLSCNEQTYSQTRTLTRHLLFLPLNAHERRVEMHFFLWRTVLDFVR